MLLLTINKRLGLNASPVINVGEEKVNMVAYESISK